MISAIAFLKPHMKIFWTNVNVRLIFIGLEEEYIKFGYSKKATKFDKIFHLKFDVTY